uniref:Uncharacterized protein n=1 Tax=Trieres chinensis TaxID=1514140 RepID=A0A7S1ZUY8_TRICV|mmetsp:Transcript_33435/g.68259  ORF Transcript_33435/g.68259 Transcript_33435/m.68259 type:complete len:278 (+) Transcript_33435:47-880(+)|eukprot:CAMPEP_0183293172 /NCGR_PEP_ID=MMETSP0160_2-20130417/1963_1 /TAXON_ID=2839 ORGANISM="Odontella Sinensis, Strain Grunow 1884" /NCGR_SAMPLE_ID=MMETSP0160_2 /ASSEMBLY_ACC=CAM_ASM_000250 /LENGTH=277 /DNA_ID=CAMNT_0025454245 /DNA_START=47 /DNA_END=880 /DNA_ORIENTATION=+
MSAEASPQVVEGGGVPAASPSPVGVSTTGVMLGRGVGGFGAAEGNAMVREGADGQGDRGEGEGDGGAPLGREGIDGAAEDGMTDRLAAYGEKAARGLMGAMFTSCEADPRGSVHRAWGVSLIFIVMFFVVAIAEVASLNTNDGSTALTIAASWTGLTQLAMAVLGTFVLKRFPTSFSVGFFLGLIVIVAQQNLLLFATFHGYRHGTPQSNHIFADLALTLFVVYVFFALILFHFREHILVAPVDAKNFTGGGVGGSRSVDEGGVTVQGTSYDNFGER